MLSEAKADTLVVKKKYDSPAGFVKVFLERQARIKKILDKKIVALRGFEWVSYCQMVRPKLSFPAII